MSAIVPRSYGGDTPNSMAVERATEPSLRSYSPTSSIRGGASDADYNDSPPSGQLNFSPSHSVNFVPSPSTPLTESVATLVPFESPQGTLVDSPAKDKETSASAQNNETSEDFVVVSSGTPSAVPSETAVERARESTVPAPSTSAPSTERRAKPFLGLGRIDAKAQDDFIAFMMGKK